MAWSRVYQRNDLKVKQINTWEGKHFLNDLCFPVSQADDQ